MPQLLVGLSCRHAHVDTTAEDAERMCSTLHGTKLYTKNLIVEKAREKNSPIPTSGAAAEAIDRKAGVSEQRGAQNLPQPKLESVPVRCPPVQNHAVSPTQPFSFNVPGVDLPFVEGPAIVSVQHTTSMAADKSTPRGSQHRRSSADVGTQEKRKPSPRNTDITAETADEPGNVTSKHA